jgi:protein required for attachment to host cells
MLIHWYVVANQDSVRVFSEVEARIPLKLLKEIKNPIGRERKRALIRKEAGRGTKMAGRGVVHFRTTKRSDPHEEAAIQFAAEVADYLKTERRKKSFDLLTVVAEARFLGKMKSALGEKFIRSGVDWVKKDLQKSRVKELSEALKIA